MNTNSSYQYVVVLLTIIFAISTANASSKSDLAKEKRWEEQVVPSLMVGEEMKLNADGVEFLALYAEPTTEKSKGAVIILHGIGVHPAWPDVIDPLRMQLPDLGWHTLSLQMPILKNEAENKDYPPLFPEAAKRIQAGVDFLKNKGIKAIVIAGHSLGSSMAHLYFATAKDPAATVFTIISGGPGYEEDSRTNTLENFKKIKDVYIIDIHGSEDMKFVVDTQEKRKLLAPKIHGNRYQNIEIKGADHFYRGKQDELVIKLNSLLEKQISQ